MVSESAVATLPTIDEIKQARELVYAVMPAMLQIAGWPTFAAFAKVGVMQPAS